MNWVTPGGDTKTISGSSVVGFDDDLQTVVFDITTLTGSSFGYKISAPDTNFGYATFFSKQAETVWTPKTILYYDDYTYTAPSTSSSWINCDDIWQELYVYFDHLPHIILSGQKIKIDLSIRPSKITKTWTTGSVYLQDYYLSTDYVFEYKIVDDRTGVDVVGYNEYMNFGFNEGYSMTLDTTAFYPDRFYRLEVRGKNPEGEYQYFVLRNNFFKIGK